MFGMWYTDPSRLAFTNFRAFVRAMRDGCVLYNDNHQNIEKRILIDRIFHFRRCQVILWRNEMEPFDRVWFGCCPSGRILSGDYGIPTTCSSNDVTLARTGQFRRNWAWKRSCWFPLGPLNHNKPGSIRHRGGKKVRISYICHERINANLTIARREISNESVGAKFTRNW